MSANRKWPPIFRLYELYHVHALSKNLALPILYNLGMEESQLFVHASVPAHVKFKAVMAEVMDSQIPEQQKITGVLSIICL